MRTLKRLFKNIFVYLAVFSLLGLVVNQVISFMEEREISPLAYRTSKIENFLLHSVGRESYIMKGDSMVDYGKRIHITSPTITVDEGSGKTEIKSKEAFYFPVKEMVFFIGDVVVNSGSTTLNTQKLVILMGESLAYNDTDNRIFSKGVKIDGKNLFFDMKKKNILLDRVKTEVYGSDG